MSMKRGKRKIRKLVSSVLLVALLVTAIPFHNWGSIVAWAETDPEKPAVDAIEVASVEEFQSAITSMREEGVVIRLTDTLYFDSSVEIEIPAGNLWIEMAGYFIDGIENLKFAETQGDARSHYIHLDGMNSDGYSAGELYLNDALHIGSNVKFVMENMSEFFSPHILVESGGELMINGKDYSNTATSAKGIVFSSGLEYTVAEQNAKEIVIDTINPEYGLSFALSGEGTARCTIDDYFWQEIGQAGYEKVTIPEGVFPRIYTSEADGTLQVNEIQIYGMIDEMQTGSHMTVAFDIQEDWDVTIYNESNYYVTATNDTDIWVAWGYVYDESNYDEVLYEKSFSNDEGERIIGGSVYLKAGEEITLKPAEGYTIYNIFCRGLMEADSPYITYKPDGSRVIEIPSCSLYNGITISTAPIETKTIVNDNSSVYYQFDRLPDYEETFPNASPIDWYEADFTIKGKETTESKVIEQDSYHVLEEKIQIYEVAKVDDAEWSADGTVISVEGNNVTVECIAIDKSIERYSYDYYDDQGNAPDGVYDEVVENLSMTYGMETKLTYTYSMDRQAPKITKVTATDATGEKIVLEGSWQEDGATTETKKVWVNKSSLTLTVEETEDTDNSTAVDGYALLLGKDAVVIDWSKDNYVEINQDGYYDLHFYVRDAYDAANENSTRALEQMWVSAIGIDTIAPIIFASDAISSTPRQLEDDAEYEGNLYLAIKEDGSGIAAITAYELVDDSWKKADVLIATGQEYYIAQNDEDKAYRIEVEDVAGNMEVYDNIVVKGYTQDVEITVGNAGSIYGEDLNIEITLENTSDYVVKIDEMKLREDATDALFSKMFESTTEIAAGEEFKTVITLPAGANAGDYDAMLDVVYQPQGDKYTTVTKANSVNIEAVIEQAQGSGSVTMPDFYYGENGSYTLASDTNDIKNVKISYKEKDAKEATFTDTMPSEVGTYIIRVQLGETDNYKAIVVEDTFTIARLIATEEMYKMTAVKGNNGWYTSDVTITAAKGYKLSSKVDGTYQDTLKIEESTDSYQFYIKKETGAITDAVQLTKILIDKTAPETGENEGIYVMDTWWQKLISKITFGIYQTETVTVQIKAHDEESDIASIQYYIANKALNKADLNKLDAWEKGTSFEISVEEAMQYVIYAKLENKAGLVSYISSEGIVIEETQEEELQDEEEEEQNAPSKITNIGTVYLEAGVPYQLGTGTWKVAGDNTIYPGGIVFYIEVSGDYQFVQE